MKVLCRTALFLLLCACLTTVRALGQKSSGQKAASVPHLSKQTRLDLIHAFTSELVYIRTPFPMGKKGLTLKDGVISPNGDDLKRLMALWGPAVKPGDEARLTSIVIKDDRIHFEINGGPIKKQKWYQHIQVGAGGSTAPISPGDQNANPRGTYVDLQFDHYVPELSPQQLKDLVRPVFDFDAQSALEAYLDTLPPKIKDAINNHLVLVGMNREMLIYSKGRPPRKIREKDGEIDYEEWIYGEPPQDVDFVRLVNDEVVRVESMKVDGTKTVRSEKEVDLEPKATVAKKTDEPRSANAPTLRRPGETGPERPTPSGGSVPPVLQTPPPPPAPGPSGGPNYSTQLWPRSAV